MSAPELVSRTRGRREALGLSQQELADRAGVSRQAVVAIEGGRQVPSTLLALRLARALRCTVEDLFGLAPAARLAARLAPGARGLAGAGPARVAVGEVDGAWVAHRLPDEGTEAADGVAGAGARAGWASVEPLTTPERLRRSVLVTGCAPVLGMLARRVGDRFANARATWLPGGSLRALDLLEAGLVHVAGVHLSDGVEGAAHETIIRQRFPTERMLIVNLVRWREGFVVPEGNPLGLGTAEGLLRPRLRFALREPGSGARVLLDGLLASAGAADVDLTGPEAHGHGEVAQLVRCGAADVGVAIEGVALAAGLGFVPLAEERFDLVVPAAYAEVGYVARFLDLLQERSFRAEMAHVPGYDTTLSGHVTTLDAA